MDALSSIRSKRGELARIARELGIRRSAVCAWRRVPAERVVAVSAITGIPPADLRPDIFHPTASPHVAADVSHASRPVERQAEVSNAGGRGR